MSGEKEANRKIGDEDRVCGSWAVQNFQESKLLECLKKDNTLM